MTLSPLPIDALLPSITDAFSAPENRALVIEAPPGAGKTTRVPPRLLELFPDGDVVVLEPRRLAAHLSATRVAEERGERLGETVGVQMRFHSVVGPSTRLRYVTEGVLVRQLTRDPELRGVRAVILDEFHERHLASDLSLAMLLRLQARASDRRWPLKLCVMSATLNGEAIATFLGGCPLLRSEGRSFPVDIEYVTDLDGEPLWKRVRGAVRRLLTKDDGDILVFLPGSAEIRRCHDELRELSNDAGFVVLPLHGDLPFDDQRRAVSPRQPGAPRKVILATNVAETSLTIEGVTAVIDSGLARVAGHQPWSGLPTLRVQSISRAQAAQRAGRAGRTRPGRCLRLYSKLDHDARPEFEVPEIRRLDLCELVLSLAALKLRPRELPFLDPPSAASLEAAEKLLVRLGALDENGALLPIGKTLCDLPIHPRLGRLIVAAAERQLGAVGATIAALLSERDLRSGRAGLSGGDAITAKVHGPSDVLHLLDLFTEAKDARFDRHAVQRRELDFDAVMAVERARKKLEQAAEVSNTRGKKTLTAEDDRALLAAILCAYPDRVARRRTAGTSGAAEFALAGGGGAALSPASIVRDDELVVLVDVEERGHGQGKASRTLVRLASAIEADWLLDLPGSPVHETTEVSWNSAAERVDVVRRLQYEQLVLDETRTVGDGRDAAQVTLLAQKVLATELRVFADGAELPHVLAKLELLAQQGGEAITIDTRRIEEAVRTLCQNRASLDELRGLSIIDALLSDLSPRKSKADLARLLPDHVVLSRGRRVRVHYETGKPPWVESRLQDFFGMAEGPRVCNGRVAVVLHLLAPNQRAVQVTTDLAGFWSRHYAGIRKELCRRYPRHAWPEDPRTLIEE